MGWRIIMTILKYYAENGDLIQTKDVILTDENFQIYLKEHGVERGLGYADAVKDILTQMKVCFEKPFGDSTIEASPSNIRRNTFKLYDDKKAFLKILEETLKV